MSGQLPVIPSTLPPGLYEQAGGAPQTVLLTQTTGTSGSFSPTVSAFSTLSTRSTLPSQFTGQSQATTSAPRLPSRIQMSVGAFPSIPPDLSSLAWDVTTAEKASSDQFFDQLDSQKRGYIEGEVAVPFMLNSKLPGDDLARIWDLADVNADGRLTRDTFAVAMHLIYAKCSGKEIPATLPPSLVPPSMRANGAIPSSPQRAEHQVDLFTWDDSPPVSAAQPMTTMASLQPAAPLPFATSRSKVQALNDPFAAPSNPTFSSAFIHDISFYPPTSSPCLAQILKSISWTTTRQQLPLLLFRTSPQK